MVDQVELSEAAQRNLIRLVTDPRGADLILLHSKANRDQPQNVSVPQIKAVLSALVNESLCEFRLLDEETEQ